MSCENHKKEVAGINDMKQLAEMICDFNYESFHELTKEMVIKLKNDSEADYQGGGMVLGRALKGAYESMKAMRNCIGAAAEVSKPFMKS